MSYDIEGHVLYALRNAVIKKWPYPHFFVQNVFPDDFYDALIHHLAGKTDYAGKGTAYHGRTFGEVDDMPELAFMNSASFLQNVASIFAPWISHRFKGCKQEDIAILHDLRLVRDSKGYQIGPHTDAAWKIVSLLFYLPPLNCWDSTIGTSIYMPNDPAFRCPGGPHHDFKHFKNIYTAPYIGNSCFGFFKTDNSFHGVEPVESDVTRDVLLYNIYEDNRLSTWVRPTIPTETS